MEGFATQTWQQLEEVVEKLQRRFHTNAVVKRNDFVVGIRSREKRQIDVSIRHNVGTSNLLIVVECKRSKRKVDSPKMEAFIAKMSDVRANHGIVVSERGFTTGAKNLATERGIEIYTLRDTRKGNWPPDPRIQIFVENITLDVSFINALHYDGTPFESAPDDVIHLVDAKTGEEMTLDAFVRSVWDMHGRPNRELRMEFPVKTHDGRSFKLQIGFEPRAVRFTRKARFECLGLLDAHNHTTHTDSARIVAPEGSDVSYFSDADFWRRSKAVFGVHMSSVVVSYRPNGEPMGKPEQLNALLPTAQLTFEVKRSGNPMKFNLDQPPKPLVGGIKPIGRLKHQRTRR